MDGSEGIVFAIYATACSLKQAIYLCLGRPWKSMLL